jgi:F-type H+-transporting ATPase subunit gamma
MHTLEAMRRRITSAEDLHAVVRVMKALAAVSIRQYEKAVESLAEYRRTVEMGLHIALRHRPEEVARGKPASGERWGIVVFGSDQGMCGSFNEQVASFTLEAMQALPGGPADRTILAVGGRVAGRLEDAGFAVEQQFPVPSSVPAITPVVHDVLLRVEELRFQRGIDQVLLFHNRPASGSTAAPRRLQLLPVDPRWLHDLQQRSWPSRSLPTFTMDWRRLFSALIRQHLFVALYQAFAESLASENASRLASMQAAEKNIADHLAALTSRYHQQRQQSITEELLDIVAGFETLTSQERRRDQARTDRDRTS